MGGDVGLVATFLGSGDVGLLTCFLGGGLFTDTFAGGPVARGCFLA